MRALLTSDIHLSDAPRDGYRWGIFDQIRKLVKIHSLRQVFLLGDLTEKKDRHPSSLLNRLVDEVTSITASGCEVVVLRGNHDCVDVSEPFFKFLRCMPGLTYVNAPAAMAIDDEQILLLPNEPRGGKGWSDPALTKIAARADVALMHQTIEKAKLPTGMELGGGMSGSFLRSFLPRARAIISGDIHLPQTIGDRFIYCGSPHPVDFGDEHDPRVLLMLGTRPPKSVPVTSIKKRVFVAAGMDELRSQVETLSSGDHVHLALKVPRAMLSAADTLRAEMTALAEEKRLVLYSAKVLEMKAPPRARVEGVAPALGLEVEDPTTSISRYLKQEKANLSKKEIDAGLQLLPKKNESGVYSPGPLSIEALTISGFRSFGAPQVFTIPNFGLYLLSGHNSAQPRLGANGAGKSSLWDALIFCFFGKTARGAFGPSLVNWSGEHPCIVTATFNKNGTTYSLTRTQTPNSLSLKAKNEKNPKTVTDADVTALIGLTRAEFLSSVLMGQFNSTFFDLGDSDRLGVFSDLLGLSRWEEASDLAKERTEAARKSFDAAKSEVASMEAAVVAAREVFKQAKQTRSEAMAEMTKRRADLGKQIDLLQGQIDSLDSRQRDCDARLKKLDADIQVLRKEDAEFTRGIQTLDREIDRTLGQIAANQEIIRVMMRDPGKCPTCGHSGSGVSSEIKKRVAEIKKLIADLQAAVRPKEKHLLTEKEKRERTASSLRSLSAQYLTLNEEKNHLGVPLGSKRASHRALLAQDAEIAKKMEIDSTAPLLSILRERKRVRDAAREGLAEIKKRCDLFEWWATAFRKIRLLLIEEAQKEFEVSCNNALSELGLIGWRIHCATEVENRSGGISRGFKILISAPGSPEGVKWDTWCGGETQRLRIAGAIGLSRLIEARRGVRCNLEIWDEPTIHLSSEGIRDLLSFFRWRSRDERRAVWLIDHQTLPTSELDGEVCVRLEPEIGSKISNLVKHAR